MVSNIFLHIFVYDKMSFNLNTQFPLQLNFKMMENPVSAYNNGLMGLLYTAFASCFFFLYTSKLFWSVLNLVRHDVI